MKKTDCAKFFIPRSDGRNQGPHRDPAKKKPCLIILCFLLCLSFSGCYESREARRERDQEIAESAYQDGYEDGYSDGNDDGYYDGYIDGYNDASVSSGTQRSGLPYTGEGIAWQETPGSTAFAYVGYDSQYEKLAVIFRSNDSRTYVYSDFSIGDFLKFMEADSLGSYYNANIKNRYPCERIDDTSGTYFEP